MDGGTPINAKAIAIYRMVPFSNRPTGIFNDPHYKGWPLFDVENLINGTRYRHRPINYSGSNDVE